MSDTCTSWCTRSHSFLRHSLLRCSQMLRCPKPHTRPTKELRSVCRSDMFELLRMTRQSTLHLLLKTHPILKLGHLSCTEYSAGESPLCVFANPGVLSCHVPVRHQCCVSVGMCVCVCVSWRQRSTNRRDLLKRFRCPESEGGGGCREGVVGSLNRTLPWTWEQPGQRCCWLCRPSCLCGSGRAGSPPCGCGCGCPRWCASGSGFPRWCGSGSGCLRRR